MLTIDDVLFLSELNQKNRQSVARLLKKAKADKNELSAISYQSLLDSSDDVEKRLTKVYASLTKTTKNAS